MEIKNRGTTCIKTCNFKMSNTQNSAATAAAKKDNLVSKPATTAQAGKIIPIEKSKSPLEERLFKLDQLFALQLKYNKLQDSKFKLSTFKLDGDTENASLSIQDENRNRFETKNPIVIGEVLEVIKKSIEANLFSISEKLDF